MTNKEIYFHTGLGKVASTYLQYKVFPRLQGLEYIQRTKYKKASGLIEKSRSDKILLSREFDRQYERELLKFSGKYPGATIILMLRRHDSWIASQYRRYVKNGGSVSFENFIDIENDTGLWKQKDLMFYPRISYVSEHFDKPPLVFLYDDIRNDFFGFLNQFCTKLGIDYNKDEISTRPFHTSYNEKQLKVIRSLAPRLFSQHRTDASNRVLKWLQHKGRMLPRYLVLYLALLVPERMVSSSPLIDPHYLNKVRKHFETDWQMCLDYVQNKMK